MLLDEERDQATVEVFGRQYRPVCDPLDGAYVFPSRGVEETNIFCAESISRVRNGVEQKASCDLSVGCSLGAFPGNWRCEPNQAPGGPE